MNELQFCCGDWLVDFRILQWWGKFWVLELNQNKKGKMFVMILRWWCWHSEFWWMNTLRKLQTRSVLKHLKWVMAKRRRKLFWYQRRMRLLGLYKDSVISKSSHHFTLIIYITLGSSVHIKSLPVSII